MIGWCNFLVYCYKYEIVVVAQLFSDICYGKL